MKTSIDDYLPPAIPKINKEESDSIIQLITEKNSLIEKYKLYIEEQTIKHQSQVSHLQSELTKLSNEIVSLKSKLSLMKSNNIFEIVTFYEKEIAKIISASDKLIGQYKNKISFLSNGLSSEVSYNIPPKDKLKQLIETLMKENTNLKEKNNSLLKITRMNEAYKSLMKLNDKKDIQNDKDINIFKQEQLSQLNTVLIENKRMKEESEDNKKIIKNLTEVIEYLKTKYDTGSISVPNFASARIKMNTELNNTNGLISSKSSLLSDTKKMVNSYSEKRAKIGFNNLKLDRYLNSCKVIISEKINQIKVVNQKIQDKIEKVNTVYKKIIHKYFKEIEEDLNIIIKETTTLLKRSDNAFNAKMLSKNLIRDILSELKKMKNPNFNESLMEEIKKYLNNFS